MKTLLLTGTGSLAKRIMHRYRDQYNIVAYSRDEYKHSLLPSWVISEIGDIRDFSRLDLVFKTHKPDLCIHTAALKVVPMLERYPLECTLTNVIGTENVARACHLNGVETSLLISTDKCVAPAQTYGASKLIARAIYADYAARSDTRFMTVLYGNVCRSRGSFIPIWEKLIMDNKPVRITHPECTRFLFTLDDSVDLIEKALALGKNGECIIPIMDSFLITDVAKGIGDILQKTPEICILNELRPGEKIHEEMMTELEMDRTFNIDDKTVAIYPSFNIGADYLYRTHYKGPIITSKNFVNRNTQDLISLLRKSWHDE